MDRDDLGAQRATGPGSGRCTNAYTLANRVWLGADVSGEAAVVRAPPFKQAKAVVARTFGHGPLGLPV